MRALLLVLALPSAVLASAALAQAFPPGACYEVAYSDADLAETYSPVVYLRALVRDPALGGAPKGGAVVVLSALLRDDDDLLVESFACDGIEDYLSCAVGDGVFFDLQPLQDGTVQYHGQYMELMGEPLVAPARDSGYHVLRPVDPVDCL